MAMERCIELVKEVLTQNDVDSRYEEESGFLRFIASTDDQDVRVVVVYATGFLTLRIYFPTKFGKTKLRQGAEFAARATWPLRFGGYYFDENTGRMAFAVYSAINGETASLGDVEELFHMLMGYAMFRVETALPILEKLAAGRFKAPHAVALLETSRRKAEVEPRVPVELLCTETIGVN
jgi:hypothetical protein